MTEFEALLGKYWNAVAAAAIANSGLVIDVTCSQKHESAHKMHQQVLEHVSTLVAELAALKARLAGEKRAFLVVPAAPPDGKEIVLALSDGVRDALYINGKLVIADDPLYAAEVLPALSDRGLVTFRDLNIKLPEGEDFPTSLADAEKMKTE